MPHRKLSPVAALTPGIHFLKTNAGSLGRILSALVGVLLLALTITGTIGLWD